MSYMSDGRHFHIMLNPEGRTQPNALKDVRYSKAQKMLKFTFNAMIHQLLLQLLQKSVQWYLTMFHTATVRPTRSGPDILYNTSLITHHVF